jgi:hypothetical protein
MANIINRQQTFSTNGTVTAAGLHNLIDTALVNSAIIKNQQEITTIGTADLLLIAPDSVDASLAPRKVTVQNLLDDGLTAGTFTSFNLTGALTYGTATGNRTVSTSATITTGTIPNLTAGTTTSTVATITTGTIPILTTGTTTSTAEIVTSGTITTLNSTTGTIATLRSTTGTIGNLSTTLAGDLTISQGTATLATSGVTAGTYGGATSIPVLTLDAKGRVTTASTSSVTSGLTGFRNRIINGDMRLDQRSGGTAYAIATSSLYGSCDRWGSFAGANGVWSQQRVTTGSTDFPFATRVQRTAGSTSTVSVYTGQVIETSNCQDIAGQTITVSYYATAGANFSATSSLIYPTIDIGTGSDQGWSSLNAGTWTGYSAISSSTQAITTTRTRYSITVAVPAGTNEIAIRFAATGTGTAGANDWFQITGVQLEIGSTATDFERRPIGTELALCQRYYLKKAALTINGLALAGNASVTNVQQDFPDTFPTMRSSPVASVSAASDFTIYVAAATRTATNLQATNTSPSSCWWIAQNNNIGQTVAVTLYASNANAFLQYNSEL